MWTSLIIGEWGIGVRTVEHMQNKTREERRWLSLCVCVFEHACVKIQEKERGRVWCFSEAPLIFAKAFIVSSGRGADEELYRRQEERRRSLLERGGVDEIITQLS